MASQAETVELLVRKAKFQPEVALAVAEAIDNAITNSQLVTVPILDARLGEFSGEIKAELAGLSKEITVTNERLLKEIAVTNERLMKEIVATNERTKAELVKWVLLAMLGSAALSMAGTVVKDAIEHYH